MYTLKKAEIKFTVSGKIHSLVLKHEDETTEESGISFWLSKEEALSGFRYRLHSHSSQNFELHDLIISFESDYSKAGRIFCNGFQSWSESASFLKYDQMKGLRFWAKPLMQPYGDYSYYDYPGNKGTLHSWNYTWVQQPGKRVLIIGSLDEYSAFTNFVHFSLENRLEARRDVRGWQLSGETILADLFTTENSERGAFQHYLMLANTSELTVSPAIGWTSWYHYYTGITEQIVLQNLEAFKQQQLPIDIFQIDDGYQQYVGDWLLVNKKFPNGMAKIAREIKAAGCKPGIWLAPLAAERKSALVKNHPDWILKDEHGKMLRIGYNPLWSGWFYALDICHPEVRAYIAEVFRVVTQEWGFELLKLDFLYGACLRPREGMSRAAVMADAMQLLRTAAGDAKILGCGIPMGTAAGFTDYCRIGADVHLRWEFNLLKWAGNRERVSTFLALKNTIHRRQLNGHAFINDPDVFMLRRKKQGLKPHEQYTLLLVNLLFGDLLFTSDNIADYDAKTSALYRSIFPLLKKKDVMVEQSGEVYKATFGIGDRKYMAIINLSDKNTLFKVPQGLYFEAVQQELVSSESGITIPAHGSILLLSIGGGLFAIAGSNGHFFPGAEIARITTSGDDIKIALVNGLQRDPVIYLKVPEDYEVGTMNGHPVRSVKKKGFKIIYTQLSRNETTWPANP